MEWIHKLNGIEVDEPTGFDAVSFKLQRQENGVEFVYTDNLTFVGTGADILRALYEIDGVDAEAVYSLYNCGTLFSEYLVNFTNYSDLNNEITVNIEQTGFLQKFKNRIELPVDLERATSIDGDAIDGSKCIDVSLHSKSILKKSAYLYSPDFNQIDWDFTLITPNLYRLHWEFPLPIQLQELNSIVPVDEYVRTTEQAFSNALILRLQQPANFIIREKGGNVTFSFRVKFNFTEISPTVNRAYDYTVFVHYGESQLAGTTLNYGTGSTSAIANVATSINIDESDTISVPFQENAGIWIYFVMSNYSAPLAAAGNAHDCDLSLTIDSVSYISFEQETSADVSDCKVSLIHEAFDKVCQIYTGQSNSFYSEYFGRTDIGYSSTGCLANISVTNGLNIRRAIDSNTSALFPITTSFKDLYDACDSLVPLGWTTEIVNGQERVRVEPLEYFYNQTSILTLDNVADIKTTPAIDKMYNEFQSGFEKWNLNNTISNGLDEFLSKRNFYIPLKNIKSKLIKVCKFIAGGYIIETTRRKQFEINQVSTFETDNDNFFICLNSSRTASEVDADFDSLTNVLFPDSLYNIRISPIRNAARWFKYLNSILFKKVTPEIQFNSGEGNYLMQSRDINSCINLPNITAENQNLNESDVVDNSRIYLPERVEFDYPISFQEFENLKNSSIFAITFSCNSTEYKKGTIEEIVYKPNSPDGGIATYKLLRIGN